MKVAFGSVIYKEGLKYVDEFIRSLNSQLELNDFSLILLNDNLEDYEMNLFLNSLDKLPIVINNNQSLSPVELRIELIKQAKKMNYDLLVLGDFDDTWSANRTNQYIEQFEEEYTFFYNDLYYPNEDFFFQKTPLVTNNLNDILERNYLGLSTTALNLKNIDEEIINRLQYCSHSIFDWYLYSLLIVYGHRGKKIINTKTYYRIHDQNLAGNFSGSIKDVVKELKVKIDHYTVLEKINPIFQEKLIFYKKLEKQINLISVDVINLLDYTDNYWWSSLKENKLDGVVVDED